nr:hypothetical protein [uncultured Rhodoferax sp.]
MQTRLNAIQVATLLVSASYGIGFLFGSGELALHWGMAGSIYAVVTTLGIAVLALISTKLWSNRLQIWEVLGEAYGNRVSKLVALLSLIWMGGILAAQIHGGVAVVKLMGLSNGSAFALMLSLIFLASCMNLHLASKVFAACLLGSSLVLLYALFALDGVPILIQAIPTFVADLDQIPTVRLWVIVLAIAPLVVTGADYQQFAMEAKSPRDAVLGALLAAVFLFLFGFFPAAVVLAYQQHGEAFPPLSETGNQAIPYILSMVSRRLAAGYGWVVLAGLLVAALGSAAAIVRAMSSAALSAIGAHRKSNGVNLAIVLLGGLIAARGQAIIDTMVALNIVYLGAIGVVYAALFTPWRISAAVAWKSMMGGFLASMIVYILGWMDVLTMDSDLASLLAGLFTSVTVAIGFSYFGVTLPSDTTS